MRSGLLLLAGTLGLWAAPSLPSIAPRRPDVPTARRGAFLNPLDAFVDVYFQKQGIAWPAAVSDALFARRVYLDLWGLVPTPDQLREFLTDARPDKRARLVDALLANRRNYSEHWVSFWNDLLRNDEGVIYHGERQSITAWLLPALAENMPYDRFVATLLHPVSKEDPAGFLIGVNWRGDVSASQIPPLQAAQNSAQVFLGVNLKCNSCHDSFISRWKLKDAYGLASFFSEKPLEIYRCDKKTGEISQSKFLYPELGDAPAEAPLDERRAAAARLFTGKENGRFARTFVNRIWDRLFGRGLVGNVDDMDQAPWDADLLDWLAADFVDHQYDVQFLLRRILTSRTYQLPAVVEGERAEGKFVFRGPFLRRLTAEEFVDGISAITGEWRILKTNKAGAGAYARDWRLKSSPLTRALGRPIRDQVFTERNTQSTTLQALEVVNGESMANLLHRGSRRMLGQLRPAPENLYDSGVLTAGAAEIDIDIRGVKQLWLLLDDADSYDPSRTVAGWVDAELTGPEGAVRLADLMPSRGAPKTGVALHFKNQEPAAAVTAPLNSTLVYEIGGRGFNRFRAKIGVDQGSLKSDISPRVRFFVFAEEPDPQQLVRVEGDPPVVTRRAAATIKGLTEDLYRHALSRDPLPAEQQVARKMLAGPGGKASADGLEDLLWAVFLSPEFQFIQ